MSGHSGTPLVTKLAALVSSYYHDVVVVKDVVLRCWNNAVGRSSVWTVSAQGWELSNNHVSSADLKLTKCVTIKVEDEILWAAGFQHEGKLIDSKACSVFSSPQCSSLRFFSFGLSSPLPPLLPRELPQRWLPKRPFVKNGADCRPSIFGWRSSWAGMCCPTGCTQWPLLRSHVSNYMSCYSTGLPGAAKGIPMKRKHTVDLPTEKSRHGGSNAKSGCCITNANVRHLSWTLKAFCMHSGARKRMLGLRLMHIWNIAKSGGKQERALTSSSDDDSCRMWETRLSKKMQKWTWRTSDLIHGWHGGLHGGRDAMRGWEGRE